MCCGTTRAKNPVIHDYSITIDVIARDDNGRRDEIGTEFTGCLSRVGVSASRPHPACTSPLSRRRRRRRRSASCRGSSSCCTTAKLAHCCCCCCCCCARVVSSNCIAYKDVGDRLAKRMRAASAHSGGGRLAGSRDNYTRGPREYMRGVAAPDGDSGGGSVRHADGRSLSRSVGRFGHGGRWAAGGAGRCGSCTLVPVNPFRPSARPPPARPSTHHTATDRLLAGGPGGRTVFPSARLFAIRPSVRRSIRHQSTAGRSDDGVRRAARRAPFSLSPLACCRRSVRPSVRPSVDPSVRSSVRLRPFIHPFVRPSDLSVRLSVSPSVLPSIRHKFAYRTALFLPLGSDPLTA